MNGLLLWITVWIALYALHRASQLPWCARCMRPLMHALTPSWWHEHGGRFVMTPFYAHYSTRALCHRMSAFGHRHRVVLRRWFAPGVACSALGAVGALALLAHNLVRFVAVQSALLLARYAARQTAQAADDDSGAPTASAEAAAAAASLAAAGQASAALRGELLQLSLPGITLPWSKFGYLLLALGTAMALHELGHALAAAAHGVPPVRVGVLLGAGVFPAAYVELKDNASEEEGDEREEGFSRHHDEEAQRERLDRDRDGADEEAVPLQARHARSVLVAPVSLSNVHSGDGGGGPRLPFPSLAPVQKLSVTSAGIWHNLVLCVLCMLLLWFLPVLLWPAYAAPAQPGLVLLGTNEAASPALAQSPLLRPGALLTHLDEAPLSDVDTWHSLLLQSARGVPNDGGGDGGHGSAGGGGWGHCVSRAVALSAGASTEASEARLLYDNNSWRWVYTHNGSYTRTEKEQAFVDQLCCIPGVVDARNSCFLMDSTGAATAVTEGGSGASISPTDPGAPSNALSEQARSSLARVGPASHACFRAVDVLRQGASRCVMGRADSCEPATTAVAGVGADASTETALAPTRTNSSSSPVEERTCMQLSLSDPRQRLFVLRIVEPRPDRSCTAATALEDGCSTVLLFVGRPGELFHALRFTTLLPRGSAWLGSLLPSPIFSALVHVPAVLAESIRWVLAVSASLALLNCAPMHMADGAHSLRCAADLLLQRMAHSRPPSRSPSPAASLLVSRVDALVRWTLLLGSSLFALNLAITLAFIVTPNS